MGKFCIKCGKSLEEGAVCSCQEQQQPTQQPVQQQYQQASTNKIGVYFNKLWRVTVQIIKTPADMLKKYVAASDTEVAFGYIGAQAIAFALFLVVLFAEINSAMGGFGSMMSLLGGSSLKFPLVKIFFVTLILSIALSFAFAGILFFFTKVVFKGETDFKKMICVAGAKSLAAVPFTVVGLILTLIKPNFGILIISMGVILGYFYVAAALKGAVNLNENKIVYTLFLSFAVMVIILCIVIKMIIPIYMPSDISSLYNGLNYFK